MVLLPFKRNVEPERKLVLLEHSLLPAFLQQPSLRFPGTALPGEAVVSKEGQRNPSTWSLWGSGDAPLPSPLWMLQLGFASVCSGAGTSSAIHLTLGKGKAFPSLDKGPAGHWDGARQDGGDGASWHCRGGAAAPQHSPSCFFSILQGSSVAVCRWGVKGLLHSFPA